MSDDEEGYDQEISLFKRSRQSLRAKSDSVISEPEIKKIKLDKVAENPPNVMQTEVDGSTFQGLGIKDRLQIRLLNSLEIQKPTKVQKYCIPQILKKLNVVACSETGSGKTAAFLLPILQELSIEAYGIFALIVAPTRELAIQLNEQVMILGSSLSVSSCLLIGGESSQKQTSKLLERPNFVVATPGRLYHHLTSPSTPFVKYLRFLVLDEADKLFTPDFLPLIEKCIHRIDNLQESNREKRQNLLFSATYPSDMSQIYEFFKRHNSLKLFEYQIESSTLTKTPTSLTHHYVLSPKHIKLAYFLGLLRYFLESELLETTSLRISSLSKLSKVKQREDYDRTLAERPEQIIVFTSTTDMCALLYNILLRLNFNRDQVKCLHSKLDQSERKRNLRHFKRSLTKILVATDVASRGLDIPKVDLVINYDVPKYPEVYIHRAGRTGRATRKGEVVTIITERDTKRNKIKPIEKRLGSELEIFKKISEKDALLLLTKATNVEVLAKSMMKDENR